jgi:hypothetical protein
MTITLPCPHCGADYAYTGDGAITWFECLDCGIKTELAEYPDVAPNVYTLKAPLTFYDAETQKEIK